MAVLGGGRFLMSEVPLCWAALFEGCATSQKDSSRQHGRVGSKAWLGVQVADPLHQIRDFVSYFATLLTVSEAFNLSMMYTW